MRKPLIVANWKMNKTVSDAIRFVTELQALASGKQEAEIVLAAPFTALFSMEVALQNTSFGLAAQNMHDQPYGAYTGEISPSMLVDLSCGYVILGHSERRATFGESDDLINQKIHSALEYGLRPIVCLGETWEVREKGETFQWVEQQLVSALRGVSEELGSEIIIAYEPIWAIGTGQNASPEQAQEVHAFLREKLGFVFRKDIAQKIRLIYGGSVDEENIDSLMEQTEIDGALVGGASLEASRFSEIISYGA